MVSGEKLLEERAVRLRDFLNPEVRHSRLVLPRPFTAEFAGAPSAGKTTAMVQLDNFFRNLGLRVIHIQEGAEVVRNIPRTGPLYNIATGLHALRPLINIVNGHTYDIALFDRGVFDVPHWLLYWLEKGLLTPEDAETYRKFFLSPLWTKDVDISFYFVCDAKVAMKRELSLALSQKEREVTNEASIDKMVKRYKDLYEVLSPQYPQLRLLDTTRLTPQEMIERVAEEVFTAFETRL